MTTKPGFSEFVAAIEAAAIADIKAIEERRRQQPTIRKDEIARYMAALPVKITASQYSDWIMATLSDSQLQNDPDWTSAVARVDDFAARAIKGQV